MSLTQTERKIVKIMAKHENWNVLMKFVMEEIEKIQAEEIVGQTAFDTLRMLHKNQGKVEGIKEVFDKLERQAFDD